MSSSVDRLGRSLQDLVGFLSELHALRIDLFLHQQGLDTTTPGGKAVFQMLGVFAEFERSMIQERVRAGLRRVKEEGKKLGRPEALKTRAGTTSRRVLFREPAPDVLANVLPQIRIVKLAAVHLFQSGLSTGRLQEVIDPFRRAVRILVYVGSNITENPYRPPFRPAEDWGK